MSCDAPCSCVLGRSVGGAASHVKIRRKWTDSWSPVGFFSPDLGSVEPQKMKLEGRRQWVMVTAPGTVWEGPLDTAFEICRCYS